MASKLGVALFASLVAPASAAAEVLRVALISEFTGDQSPSSARFINGFRDFAAPHINNKGGISLAGDAWLVEVVDYDTQSRPADTVPAILGAIKNGTDAAGTPVGEVHAIVAGTAASNGPIKAAAQELGIVNIHTSGGNPNAWSEAQSFAFGMHLPFTTYTRGLIRMAAIRGMKTIAIVRSFAHGFSRASCIAALEWARLSGLRVIGPSVAWCRANAAMTGTCRVVVAADGAERCVCGLQADVDSFGYKYSIEETSTFYEMDETLIGNGLQWNVVDRNTTDFARSMFQDMREGGEMPDVVLNFATEWHNVLNAMWEEDFSPKMLFGWHGGTTPTWAADSSGVMNETHGLWAMGFGQWHPAMSFTDPLFGTNEEAVRLFAEANNGQFLDYDTAGAVASGVVLYKAMQSYVSEDFKTMTLAQKRSELKYSIGQMNDETMWGLVRFNRNNQNAGRDTAAWQVLPDANLVPQQLCVLPSEAAEVELAIPFPTWGARFGCDAGMENDLSKCSLCPAGTHNPAPSPGLTKVTCSVCSVGVGTVPDASGAKECPACAVGRSHEDGSGICSPCSRGTFRSAANSTAASEAVCEPCPSGTFSDVEGATRCVACSPGTFTKGVGATVCEKCMPGSVASGTGSSACTPCVVGTFAEALGSEVCTSCSFRMTTLHVVQMLGKQQIVYLEGAKSQTTCGCDVGFYASGGSCETCPRGMTCAIGTDIANLAAADPMDGPDGSSLTPYPVAEPGHWTAKSEPLSVFACRSASSCPGGAPESCGPHLLGQACDRCETAYAWTGEECTECNSVEESRFLFPALPALIIPVVILVMYWKSGDTIEKWESWRNTCTCLVFIALNHYQVADVVRGSNVLFPEEARGVFDVFVFTNDFSTLFKPDCAGFAGFEAKMSSKAVGPIVVLCIGGAVLLASRAVDKVLGSETRRLNLEANRLFNVVMSLMFTFFNAIMSLSLLLFKCSPNPNGLQTLSVDHGIVCWSSGKWLSMLVIGLLCVFFYVGGFGALFTRAILLAPRGNNFRDAGFRARWKFLFIKFRSTVHWWSLAFLAKNFLLNLGQVVLTSGIEQLAWMMSVTVCYMFAVTVYMPYRVPMANFAEVVSSISIIMVSFLIAWFADREDGRLDQRIGTATAVLIFVPFVVMSAMVAYVARTGSRTEDIKRSKAKQHDFVIDQFRNAVNLATNSKELSVKFFEGLSSWDWIYATRAAEVFAAELMAVRGNSSTKLLHTDAQHQEMLQRMSSEQPEMLQRTIAEQPGPKCETSCNIVVSDLREKTRVEV